jgi:hypothetical protein
MKSPSRAILSPREKAALERELNSQLSKGGADIDFDVCATPDCRLLTLDC